MCLVVRLASDSSDKAAGSPDDGARGRKKRKRNRKSKAGAVCFAIGNVRGGDCERKLPHGVKKIKEK